MLERLTDPRFKAISEPCQHALDLTARILESRPDPVIAEIGIGIGATSLQLCRLLNHRGRIWIFDFEDRVAELQGDLNALGFSNITIRGNSRRTFDSYGWTLAVLLRQSRHRGSAEMFDFIYLDGCHLYPFDTMATVCAKAMLKPGGYLLMDDYDWSILGSPTMTPELNPSIRQHYSPEQIELSHVEMICSILLDTDPVFERVPIGYKGREHRRAYRKSG
ncbi:MAG: class I SAM-dependent methyltransferase [Acetobacteraceae bacterium]